MMKPEKTKYYSWKNGNLAKGCQLCVQGRKLVLFVTGLCSRKCYYCPISDAKKDLDVVYANEWRLKDEDDFDALIKEAKLTDAKGAGITGGDPLVRIERTVKYIKLLKKKFGKSFHIHLYTLPELVTEDALMKLNKAGLDEIRLHPDIENKKHWWKIELLKRFSWDVGVEIPAVPGMEKETVRLINYFKDDVDFLNINELEVSDTNAYELLKKGFMPKDKVSYGVKGSQEMALSLLKRYADENVEMHYCTTTLKDRVQLSNRIKIRAKNVKKPFDEMTKEGMLIRGAVYLPELAPGFGYRKKLEEVKKDRFIKQLEDIKKDLQKKYRIPSKMIIVDREKPRILTSKKFAARIKKDKELRTAIVTEYPTWDQTEIDVKFI
ncbi:MAG TPA: radical SAM protein [Candidatus Nanoarchaeia archaeon]|nr:radical SAM protein [Candidatus Nanoarchaeia archaeon]